MTKNENKPPLQVLMVLEHLFPPDIRVEKEINSLLLAGYKVVLACRGSESGTKTEVKNNLTIIRRYMPALIYKSSVGSLRFPLYFKFWRAFLREISKQYDFDLVHIHDLPLAKVGLELRNKLNISLILDLHENYPSVVKASPYSSTFIGKLLCSHKQWLKYEKKMIHSADIVFTVVEEQRDRLIAMTNEPNKHFIVRNTPVLETITPPPESDKNGNFIFIYAGSFGAARGFDVLIPALKLVVKEKPNAHLWLVGEGKITPTLKRTVQELGLTQNVTFHGWQNHQKMMSLISQSDVALLPLLKTENYDHSGPNKLFQYMMLGKPIIASNCIAVERIMKECNTGLIYKDKNVTDLKDKMIYAMYHQSELESFGRNGKQAVLDKYNWQISSVELLMGYEKAL